MLTTQMEQKEAPVVPGLTAEHRRILSSADVEILVTEKARLLGVGGFGMVWLPQDEPKALSVWKTARKRSQNESGMQGCTVREIAYPRWWPHATGIPSYRFRDGRDNPDVGFVRMVHLAHGSLSDSMWLHKRCQFVRAIVHNVLLELDQLHHGGLMHGDLSLENIMLKSCDDDVQCKEHEVVLSDFGQCRFIGAYALDPSCATNKVEYRAPEQWYTNGSACYGPAAEVWAVGYLALRLLCGTVDELEMDEKRADDLHRHLTKWPERLAELKSLNARALLVRLYGADEVERHPLLIDFLQGALTVDAAQRPTTADLLSHPFLMKTSAEVLAAAPCICAAVKWTATVVATRTPCACFVEAAASMRREVDTALQLWTLARDSRLQSTWAWCLRELFRLAARRREPWPVWMNSVCLLVTTSTSSADDLRALVPVCFALSSKLLSLDPVDLTWVSQQRKGAHYEIAALSAAERRVFLARDGRLLFPLWLLSASVEDQASQWTSCATLWYDDSPQTRGFRAHWFERFGVHPDATDRHWSSRIQRATWFRCL